MKTSSWMWMFPVMLVLAACASATGWFVEDFYHRDAALMAARSRYADLLLMSLVAPLGAVMFVLARTGRLWAKVFLMGIVMYLAFTDAILTFAYHQNALFPVYVAVLGLSVFTICVGLPDIVHSVDAASATIWTRLASAALFLVVLSGSGFWLSDVVAAAIGGEPSASLLGVDLPVNVAQVLDLAFMLPLAFFGALKLWKHQPVGLVISAVMSVFFVLIGVDVIVMDLGAAGIAGTELDPGKMGGFGFTISMSLFVAVITYGSISRTTK